jgi:hypothetical protein
MKRGIVFASDGVVARSLKLTRATSILVGALAAGVSLNVMVAMQFVGTLVQALLIVIVFATLGFSSSAMASDVLSRSEQSVASLRSMGATHGGLAGAMLGVVLVWGLVGAALGTGLGSALGMAAGGSAGPLTAIVDGAGVIVASAGAVVAGVYLGARSSWHS